MIDKTTPAFPTTVEHGFNSGMPGMNLRDSFAGKAMQGFCTGVSKLRNPDWEAIAEDAYQMADAMMKVRK